MTDHNRHRLYKLLRVGKSELYWDDEFYRQMLTEFGAKPKDKTPSASTMSIVQLETMLAHMKKCGFKVKSNPRRLSAEVSKRKAAQMAKLTALWCCLHDHGVVRNRDAAAMGRFVARINGKKPLRWTTPAQLSDAIEALKKMAQRAGLNVDNLEEKQQLANNRVPTEQ